jgi:hypothetical protein
MKTLYYFDLLLIIFFLYSCANESVKDQVESQYAQNSKDSSWTYNEYKSEKLSIDFTNHNLKDFSIDVHRKRDSLRLDLNELKGLYYKYFELFDYL